MKEKVKADTKELKALEKQFLSILDGYNNTKYESVSILRENLSILVRQSLKVLDNTIV